MSTSDKIEKQTVIKAARSKVWAALSDSKKFGSWFGVNLDGPFIQGKTVSGKIFNPPGYENVTFHFEIAEVTEPSRISFRWHPYAVEPNVDYSSEPTTLCTFTLEEVPEGTKLTVVESGFDQIPVERRAKAFEMNEGGWSEQLKRIDAYVTGQK